MVWVLLALEKLVGEEHRMDTCSQRVCHYLLGTNSIYWPQTSTFCFYFTALLTMRENLPHMLSARSNSHSGTSLRWLPLKLCYSCLFLRTVISSLAVRIFGTQPSGCSPHYYLCTGYPAPSLTRYLFTMYGIVPNLSLCSWMFPVCNNVESSPPGPSSTMGPSFVVALWELITQCILAMIKFDWNGSTALCNNKFSLSLTSLIG